MDNFDDIPQFDDAPPQDAARNTSLPLLIGLAAVVVALGCGVLGLAALGVVVYTAEELPEPLQPLLGDLAEEAPAQQVFTDTASPFTEAIVEPDGAAGFAVGNPDAELVVIEYGDFSCPYCYQFALETDDLLTDMMEEGRVRYIFKPLTFVNPPTSTAAADAAYCAASQGVFWPMHNALWVIFEDVGAGGYAQEQRVLNAAAGINGLDMDAYESCLAEGMPEALLDAVAEEASERDVTGTPTVFINGERVVFESGFGEGLREALQAALGGPEI